MQENKEIIYSFPIKDKFKVRDVSEPDFDIEEFQELLYVNLDAVRDNSYLDKFKYQLGIDENKLVRQTENFVKIIFSGYRGSGKTLELRNFQKEINAPERYLSIVVEIEKEVEVAKFQAEDFFVLMITKLVERLHEDKIVFDSKTLEEIQREWISEKTHEKKTKKKSSEEYSGEAGTEFKFFNLLKLGANLKSIFANETEEAITIRQKIEKNFTSLINQFNQALDEIRFGLIENPNTANDILFIFDGSEKISKKTYEDLFIDREFLINNLNLNMICAVPIYTFYNIHHKNALNSYFEATLPMIRVNEQSLTLLKEIITKRIDQELFFDQGVLDKIVQMSGGSIRQMLRIVNRAIIDTLGKRITLDSLSKTLKTLGDNMYESLKKEEKDILTQKTYLDSKGLPNIADENVWNLVFGLILFKYNGYIEINPLIQDKFQDAPQ